MHKSESILIGALYSIFSFFCFAVFGAFVKAANNAFWANFIAFVVGSLFLLICCTKSGRKMFASDKYILHICRAVFGVAASILYVVSIQYIPLLDATLLYNASPLFLPIFSIILLKTKVEPSTWLAVIGGYVGIAFIIRPTSDVFSQWGDFLGLGSGILLALAFTFVKMLTKTEAPLKISCLYLCIGTIVQVPLIFLFGPLPSLESIFFSCGAGVSLALAQISISKSYSLAPLAKVGIFQYTAVIFIGFIDWIVWKQIPGPYDVVGTIIVILAGVLIIRKGSKYKASS